MRDDEVETFADELWARARDAEQSVGRVASDEDAERVRTRVRRLAAAAGIAVRTARIDDTVVIVRVDAAVWQESAASMRAKLTPPE